ncbi:hypothetical protein SDC9_154903 [bioreactor metagenome]|uniref:Nucleoside transporter/FeoB GTPase Gate domain-containing protein n=1 Tax=bioreactor metagenome TaxID=1076179 RepID=A0A645F299_9ZZZZ
MVNGRFELVGDNNTSILAGIGNAIAPIFAPLGFGGWKQAVATVTGLIAKENVVNTFGVLYGFAEVAENGMEIWSNLALDFTALSAFSFMLFNLLCAPCFAAMGAIKTEMKSAKWTWAAIGYMTVFAYVIALIVFQLGSWIESRIFSIGTIAAIVLASLLFYLLLRKNPYEKKIAGR